MANCFFEQEFDFERYIEEQLLHVDDTDKRILYKEFIEQTIIPFYRQTEQAYAKLEMRLQQSMQKKNARYEIITGIVKSTELDITDLSMFPMQYKDLNDGLIDSEELLNCIEQGKTFPIMKVYAKMSFSQIQRIEKEERVFLGTIKTEYEEYKAEFRLTRNMDYVKQLEKLYYLFEENGVEWKTVCAPYLYKFFDVQLIQAHWPRHEKIVNVTVDFEEYRDVIMADIVPTWNIKCLEVSSCAYPNLLQDQARYEHCIYKNRLQSDREYLLGENKVKIWEAIFLDGDLHLICEESKPRRWKLLEFNYEALKKDYKFSTFVNGDNFTGHGRCINTYGMLRKYVQSLGYEKYMKLVDVKVGEHLSGTKGNTYDMDAFIKERIDRSDKKETLILGFKAIDLCSYLHEDIMSYLISRIQWQLPQYHCIGEWM